MTGGSQLALADPERCVLVAIDFQGRLMDLVYRHEFLVDDLSRLLLIAGLMRVPIVVTEQYPKGLGPTVEGVQEVLDEISEAGGTVGKVEKETFSCCGEPKFQEALDEARPPGNRQIVVAGIEAQICVVQTVLQLREQGEEVLVSSECVTGRGPEARHWALERMRQAGAQVVSTESLAFEWARTKEHEQFKAMSSILKGAELP